MKQVLRLEAQEKEKLERRRREMVSRELESLNCWAVADGFPDPDADPMPLDDVTWNVSAGDESRPVGEGWVIQPSDGTASGGSVNSSNS